MLGKKIKTIILTLLTLFSAAAFADGDTKYNVTLCGNQTYLFGCQPLTPADGSGVYVNMLEQGTTCLHLLFGAPKTTAYTAQIAPGQKYLFGCQVLTADGEMAAKQLQQNGCECDSTVTVTLKVHAPPLPVRDTVRYAYVALMAQSSDKYLFGCRVLSLDGISTASDTLDAGDHDSIITVTLSLIPPTPVVRDTVRYAYEALMAQSSDQYLFGCRVLSLDGISTASDTLDAGDHDSIITVTLSLIPPTPVVRDTVRYAYEALMAQSSDQYLFGCRVLSLDGISTASDTLDAGDHDSIITVTLSLIPPTPVVRDTVRYAYDAQMAQSSDQYLFGCRVLSLDGISTASDTLDAGDHDSIITVTLSLIPPTPVVRDTVRYAYEAQMAESSDQYLFGCRVLSLDGISTASDTLDAGDHDSIITVTLSLIPPTPVVRDTVRYAYDAQMAQSSDQYLFGCRVLSLDGISTASDTLDAGDHDSIITVTLSLIPPTPVVRDTVRYAYEAQMAESSDQYLFGCRVLSLDGISTASDTLDAGDHDSIITVTLSLIPPTPVVRDTVRYAYEAQMAESSDQYLFGCRVLSLDGISTASDTLDAGDHDSIITVTLSLIPPTPVVRDTVRYAYEAQMAESSDQYLFGCRVLSLDGISTASDTLDAGDHDSIITVTLSLIPPTPVVRDTVRYAYEAQMAESSDQYLFGCRVLSLDGISTASDTLDAGDHDSIITVTLSLIPPTPVVRDTVRVQYSADLKVNETYLLGCRQYRFNETGLQLLSDTLALPELDHDSIVFVNLNVSEVEEEDHTVHVQYTATIKEGQTYLFGCEQLTVANTYTNTLQRVEGGDSIVHLTLNVLNYTYGDTVATECDSLLWHNQWRKETKEYADTLIGANIYGGDSIVTLHLTLLHSTTAEVPETYEACDSVIVYGKKYTVSGLYADTLVNAAGCDSIVALNITVKKSTTAVIPETYEACDSVIVYGKKYTVSGLYADTLVNAAGCDSIVALNITVKKSTTAVIPETYEACDSVIVYGKKYTVSGLYADTLVNAAGCDSIITMNITVKKSTTASIPETYEACDSVIVYGKKYTVSGLYADTLVNAAGCDSIVALNITVKKSTTAVVPETYEACDSVIVYGKKYTVSGLYADTLVNAAGCDSIITMNITVKKSTTAAVPETYEACDSVIVYGKKYTVSGLYADTLVNAAGCDSIVALNITVKKSTTAAVPETYEACDSVIVYGKKYTVSGLYADTLVNAAGCDSIVALNITVKKSTTAVIPETYEACDSVIVYGKKYTVSGLYADTLVNAAGCDSIVSLNITVKKSTTAVIPETYEACDSVIVYGKKYTVSGLYADTLVNAAGCDSIVSLNITVKKSTTAVIPETYEACDSVIVYGKKYTVSGLYADTLVNAAGCDSIVALNITVKKSTTAAVPETYEACDSVIVYGKKYTVSGLYADTLVNAAGCDSIITMNITVKKSTTASIPETYEACDSVIVYGKKYTVSGLYADTLVNAAGCDSIITMNITVKKSTSAVVPETYEACDSVIVYGKKYTVSGLYADTLVNAAGCDSIVALNITVKKSTTAVVPETYEACDSVIVYGKKYTVSGLYADTLVNAAGCDSIVALNITVKKSTTASIPETYEACDSVIVYGKKYTVSGLYADTLVNAAGCDSIITMNITVKKATIAVVPETYEACDSVIVYGKKYTVSGLYADTLVNAAGCDSIVALNITVKKSTTAAVPETYEACDSVIVYGKKYTVSGLYADTLVNAAGCDSIITMNITVKKSTTASIPETYEACDSVIVYGKKYTVSGLYADTLVNAAGCDSIVALNITVKKSTTAVVPETYEACDSVIVYGKKYTVSGLYADTLVNAAGCDSIVALNITVKKSTTAVIPETYEACDSVIVYGKKYTVSGLYADTLVNAAGCDSIITMNITVKKSTTAVVPETYEACDSVIVYGKKYTVSGLYADTLVNAAGCDSVITMNITVKKSTTAVVPETYEACDSVIVYGKKYTVSGLYADTLVNAAGCDSIVALNITVNKSTTASIPETYEACDSVIVYGKKYTVSGLYADTLVNAAGCDSIVALNITVKKSTTAVVPETYEACDSVIVYGKKYTVSGLYADTLVNAAGCDSIVALNITVKKSTTASIPETYEACDSVIVYGKKYTVSGLYADTLVNAAGCDSIVALNITVKKSTTAVVPETYEACDSVIVYGKKYTVSGLYADTLVNAAGCDSIVALNITVKKSTTASIPETYEACDSVIVYGKKYTVSGLYADTLVNAAGCDSIVALNITVKKSTTAVIPETYEACDSVIVYGKKYTVSGLYADTLVNAAGCDSIVALNITVKKSTTAVVPETYEACDSVIVYGKKYTVSGLYADTLVNAAGCDSIITMNITVKKSTTAVVPETYEACDSVIVYGKKYTVSGLYADTLVNAAGCDSIVALNITVKKSTTAVVPETYEACDSVIVYGKKYTVSGLYADTLVNAAGCDSIITMNITVKKSTTAVVPETYEACDSVIVYGKKYTVSGLYADTLVNAAGCDSIVALNITVKKSTTAVVPETYEACDSVIVYGKKYTVSGLYADTLVNAAGCDSIITMNITVKKSTTAVIPETYEACDSVIVYGKKYTVSGLYADTLVNAAGCDSVIALDITIHKSVITAPEVADECNLYVWHDVLYNEQGTHTYYDTLTTIHGCDSICQLTLTITTPYDTLLSLVHKFGDRLLMINRKEINQKEGWFLDSLGIEHPEYVIWYQIDPNGITTEAGQGYYLNKTTGDPLPVGYTYYAVINIPAAKGKKCGVRGETEHYTIPEHEAPALIPSLARPGEGIRIVNLIPDEETTIRVFSVDGKLLNTYTSVDTETFSMEAEYRNGVYLVELDSSSIKTTLRYIVK